MPQEVKATWKQHTRERFDKVLTTLRTEREARAADEPHVQAGKDFNDLIDRFELGKDIGYVPKEHIAGLVKVQAAVNRGLLALQGGQTPAPQDVKLLAELGQTIDSMRGKFGIQAPVAAPSIKPLQGELPADLAELVSVYGLPEQRVRLLAAMEAAEKAATKPPERQAPPQQPTPPAPPAQQPPQQPQPGVNFDQIYGRKLVTELATLGEQDPNKKALELLHSPEAKQEVMRQFPGVTIHQVPMVFDSLGADKRFEILLAAYRATAKRVPARPPATPPPATNQRTVPATRSPRHEDTDAPLDAVQMVIERLAKPQE